MTHAVVIGAGGGIGQAVAIDQAVVGAAVSLVDISAGRLQQASDLARSYGSPDVDSLVTDPATPEGIERLGTWLTDRPRAVDRLVYAAGVTGPVALVGEYPLEAFAEVLRINLHGPFLVLSHLLPRLLESSSPSVVLVGSTSAIRGRAGLSGYVASKHGVLGLVRAAAMDLSDGPVRVNAVLPGPVDTPMLSSLEHAAAADRIDFGRAGPATGVAAPQDIASTIGFLLSERSRHVRGAAWVIDGGVTIG